MCCVWSWIEPLLTTGGTSALKWQALNLQRPCPRPLKRGSWTRSGSHYRLGHSSPAATTMGDCLTIVTNLLVKSTTTAGKIFTLYDYTIVWYRLAPPLAPCQSCSVCVWNIQLRTAIALGNGNTHWRRRRQPQAPRTGSPVWPVIWLLC